MTLTQFGRLHYFIVNKDPISIKDALDFRELSVAFLEELAYELNLPPDRFGISYTQGGNIGYATLCIGGMYPPQKIVEVHPGGGIEIRSAIFPSSAIIYVYPSERLLDPSWGGVKDLAVTVEKAFAPVTRPKYDLQTFEKEYLNIPPYIPPSGYGPSLLEKLIPNQMIRNGMADAMLQTSKATKDMADAMALAMQTPMIRPEDLPSIPPGGRATPNPESDFIRMNKAINAEVRKRGLENIVLSPPDLIPPPKPPDPEPPERGSGIGVRKLVF